MEPEKLEEGQAPAVEEPEQTLEEGEPTEEEPQEGTPEEGSEAPVEEPEDSSKDIDFKKEAEELEGKGKGRQPERTDEEKAKFAFNSTVSRMKDLGLDPAKELGVDKPAEPTAPQGEFVTKEDLARSYASSIIPDADEIK